MGVFFLGFHFLFGLPAWVTCGWVEGLQWLRGHISGGLDDLWSIRELSSKIGQRSGDVCDLWSGSRSFGVHDAGLTSGEVGSFCLVSVSLPDLWVLEGWSGLGFTRLPWPLVGKEASVRGVRQDIVMKREGVSWDYTGWVWAGWGMGSYLAFRQLFWPMVA